MSTIREESVRHDDASNPARQSPLDLYETAIGAARDASGRSRSAIRDVLLAREQLDRRVKAAAELDPRFIEQLSALDRRCRDVLKASHLPARDLEAWRSAAGGDPQSWWWAPEAVSPRFSRIHTVLNVAAWLTISVALTAFVQLARRAVGGDDLWSLVAQSYIALLVTGTIVEFARRWVSTRITAAPQLGSTISICVLAAALVVLAGKTETLFEKLAVKKSDDAVSAKVNRDLGGAVALYDQSLRLDPGNGITRHNLAMAAEALGDYELAEREFRKAVLDEGQDLHVPLFGLAKLALIHRRDPARALRYVDFGAAVAERSGDRIDPAQAAYWTAKYRGWAYVELKEFATAERHLRFAIDAQPHHAAAAHCLLAQALAAQGKAEAAAAECAVCVQLAPRSGREVEPSWREFAATYLAQRRPNP